jgi:hypothetical protein
VILAPWLSGSVHFNPVGGLFAGDGDEEEDEVEVEVEDVIELVCLNRDGGCVAGEEPGGACESLDLWIPLTNSDLASCS